MLGGRGVGLASTARHLAVRAGASRATLDVEHVKTLRVYSLVRGCLETPAALPAERDVRSRRSRAPPTRGARRARRWRPTAPASPASSAPRASPPPPAAPPATALAAASSSPVPLGARPRRCFPQARAKRRCYCRSSAPLLTAGARRSSSPASSTAVSACVVMAGFYGRRVARAHARCAWALSEGSN